MSMLTRFVMVLFNSYKFKYRNVMEVAELIKRNILVLQNAPEKQEHFHLCFCEIPHLKHSLEFITSQNSLPYATAVWFLCFNQQLITVTSAQCFFAVNIFQVENLSYTWSVLRWVSGLCRK